MSRLSKLGLVFAGYVAALVAAFAFVWVRSILLPPEDGSGGMQAFGDLLLFVGTFLLLALVPTAFALYFLRAFPTFWAALAIASLVFAATGPVAAAMVQHMHQFSGVMVALFGVLRVLGAPLACLGFAVCALFAPTGRSRRALLAAAAIEGGVGAYMMFCLYVLGRWLV